MKNSIKALLLAASLTAAVAERARAPGGPGP
jgi:hypothetical protein